MPQLARITATFFTTLINRLGIRPPFTDGFEISNVVQPVSIVDSDISISAVTTTQLLDSGFTNGEQAAPAANTVLADSGAQAAGNYSVIVNLGCIDTANTQTLAIQRRDAANAANIWETRFYCVANTAGINRQWAIRVALSANERIRIVNINAGAAGSKYFGHLWLQAVS